MNTETFLSGYEALKKVGVASDLIEVCSAVYHKL